MDPLPPTTATNTTYQESIDSSPRSRATDVEDPFTTTTPTTSKLRLMCSYGGHIVPRPHDKSLCYIGGDTRMVVVDRSSTFPDLISRLSKALLHGTPFTLKYQLPNEDLDSLITVSTDEDFDNMIDEYDRLQANSVALGKPSRIRLFLFPSKPEGATSIGSLLDGSNRSEDWFLNALNAAALQRVFSEPPTSVNSLLGLEDNGGMPLPNSDDTNNNVNDGDTNKITSINSNSKEVEMEMLGNGESVNNKMGKLGNLNQSNPDIQSVPDSPIIETTSPFGSTSSSPSLANLPPIRVHVEEGSVGGGGIRVLGGIEDQFAQMGLNVQKHQQQMMDDQGGFVVISSPPTRVPAGAVVAGVPAAVVGSGGNGVGEFNNRVYSDDERSDHGAPVGGRMVQQQLMQQPNVMASQMQPKLSNGGELLSPDSISSDSSFSNLISRPKPVVYQDPGAQLSSGSNRLPSNVVDPNTRIQIQQVSETGYVLPPQYDQQQVYQQKQQQQQLLQHQHHQQAQVQQYIPAGAHFVRHTSPGGVPMQAYYPVYPQQSHHLPHQYPVYYVSAGQAQGYSSANLGEGVTSNPSSQPQTLPNPTIITNSSAYNPTRNTAPPKPELAPPPVYRTTAGSGPQFVQVPPSQHQPSQVQPLAQSQMQAQAQQQQQFMSYSQIHPSQSSAGGGYAFDFPDPSQAQIYYTQSLPPSLTPQYQGMTSAHAMVMPDGSSSQIPIENVKQQIRSSQPL